VQISEPAFLDQVEGTAEHVLALGRKSGNEIRPEHDAGAAAAQLPGERNGVRAQMPSLHPLEDEVVAGLQ